MVEIVLPCCCPDERSVPVIYDDVDLDFLQIK